MGYWSILAQQILKNFSDESGNGPRVSWVQLERDSVLCEIVQTTRMHFSRMRTARLLPVSPSMRCSRMWTEFLTHASENITSPQLRCGGNNVKYCRLQLQMTFYRYMFVVNSISNHVQAKPFHTCRFPILFELVKSLICSGFDVCRCELRIPPNKHNSINAFVNELLISSQWRI